MVEHSVKIDIHDPRAAAIADVMANKTCKRILALLAERDELSESDIAQALGAPLNTVGYNMKKLVASGLVEKTKTFFWSVKGKRIPTYRLSRKEIIISPRRLISTQMLSIFAAGVLAVIIAFALLAPERMSFTTSNNDSLQYFASENELSAFLTAERDKGSSQKGGIFSVERATAVPSMAADGAGEAYSGTNIQVAGVDELDHVKNDGKYIYTVVGNNVVIVNAYPPEQMRIIGSVQVNTSIQGIFVQDDKLVILSSSYSPYQTFGNVMEKAIDSFAPCIGGCGGRGETQISVYDLRDKSRPTLVRNMSVEGSYHAARLTNGFVYVIASESLHGGGIPRYMVDSEIQTVPATSIAYIPGEEGYVFTSVFGLALEGDEYVHRTFLTGSGNTIYVSQENIYISSIRYLSEEVYYREASKEVIAPLLSGAERSLVEELVNSDRFDYNSWEMVLNLASRHSDGLRGEERAAFDEKLQNGLSEVRKRLEKEREKSIIHRIAFSGARVTYEASGEVPGRILNQFALDEHEGYLRVATTTGEMWGEKSLNHLFVLDSNLKRVGSVENLAPGERIFSVRFMGDRAYLVTFRNIDPFYVLDLANPREPKVLGYLKIPGFSNYLHPYDEHHVIGIGKDARGGSEDFAYYQGLKLSLFDVTDVTNPREVAYLGIGDRGSDSPVLHDHKALLFDRARNLLVLPVLVAEINKSAPRDPYYYNPDAVYGEAVWNGAYVLNITADNINVRGRITHFTRAVNNSWEWHDSRSAITRSLYIDETLYTVSGGQIQAHDLKELTLRGAVVLPSPEEDYGRVIAY